ncbi:hypothetical protein N0V94_002530 [Neodidymelliopsis sp. IMI 364377]|nr:hypothetical protein N0V94_002530 [Neodidymelliopsis sp. IMI 364377]
MVNWTAELDCKILKGIFTFHKIKSSGPLLDYLAKEIDLAGCTPKAVSHRLSNLRSSGKMTTTSSPAKAPEKAVATPRTPRAKVSGGGKGKATPAKKIADEDTTSDGTVEMEEPVVSPSVRRKRTRVQSTPVTYDSASTGEGDDDDEEFTPVVKRVKAEPVDDNPFVGLSDNNRGGEDEDDLAYI